MGEKNATASDEMTPSSSPALAVAAVPAIIIGAFVPPPPQQDHPESSVDFLNQMRRLGNWGVDRVREGSRERSVLCKPCLKKTICYVKEAKGKGQCRSGCVRVRGLRIDANALPIDVEEKLLRHFPDGQLDSSLDDHAVLTVMLLMSCPVLSGAEIQLYVVKKPQSEHPVEATAWCRHLYKTVILVRFPGGLGILESYVWKSLGAWFIFFENNADLLAPLFTPAVYDDFARVLRQPGADFFVPVDADRTSPKAFLDDLRRATRTLELIRKMVAIGKARAACLREDIAWSDSFFDTVIAPEIGRGFAEKYFACVGQDRQTRFDVLLAHADVLVPAFAEAAYHNFACVIRGPYPNYALAAISTDDYAQVAVGNMAVPHSNVASADVASPNLRSPHQPSRFQEPSENAIDESSDEPQTQQQNGASVACNKRHCEDTSTKERMTKKLRTDSPHLIAESDSETNTAPASPKLADLQHAEDDSLLFLSTEMASSHALFPLMRTPEWQLPPLLLTPRASAHPPAYASPPMDWNPGDPFLLSLPMPNLHLASIDAPFGAPLV